MPGYVSAGCGYVCVFCQDGGDTWVCVWYVSVCILSSWVGLKIFCFSGSSECLGMRLVVVGMYVCILSSWGLEIVFLRGALMPGYVVVYVKLEGWK